LSAGKRSKHYPLIKNANKQREGDDGGALTTVNTWGSRTPVKELRNNMSERLKNIIGDCDIISACLLPLLTAWQNRRKRGVLITLLKNMGTYYREKTTERKARQMGIEEKILLNPIS
jgi:hypothetical protein